MSEFLNDFVIRGNISVGTKRAYVCNLLYLCRFLNSIPFKQVSRDDIISYLQTLRRPLSADVKQKWISTYNNRIVIYQKFFKWLYFPEFSARERKASDNKKQKKKMLS